MIDIEALKSAEVYEGEKAIQKLRENHDKVMKSTPAEQAAPHTQIQTRDNGEPVVVKLCSGDTLIKAEADDSGPGLPSDEKLVKLVADAGLENAEEMAKRAIPYWASDERPDRHGDIVRQNFDFSEFDKNPTMPFSHQWEGLPIGKIVRRGVLQRSEKDYQGPALNTVNVFATAEQNPFADTVFRLAKGGFLPSSSIGFAPMKVIDIMDDEEREELGLGRWGLILDENMLIEHSPTQIPANVGATQVRSLRMLKASGVLQPHDILAIREFNRESAPRGKDDVRKWLELEAKTLTIWKTLFPECRGLEIHRDLDVPLVLDADRVKSLSGQDLTEIHSKLDALDQKLQEVTKSDDENCTKLSTLAGQVEGLTELLEDYVAGTTKSEPAGSDDPAEGSPGSGDGTGDSGEDAPDADEQSSDDSDGEANKSLESLLDNAVESLSSYGSDTDQD